MVHEARFSNCSRRHASKHSGSVGDSRKPHFFFFQRPIFFPEDWIAVGLRAAACGCWWAVRIYLHCLIYIGWVPGVEIYLSRGKAVSVFNFRSCFLFGQKKTFVFCVQESCFLSTCRNCADDCFVRAQVMCAEKL